MPQHLSVDLASTRNVSASGVGVVVDTRTVSEGDTVLLMRQAVHAYNGAFVVGPGDWQRLPEFSTPAQMKAGTTFFVRGGNEHRHSEFYLGNDVTTVDADVVDFGRRSYARPVAAGAGLSFDPVNTELELPEQEGVQGAYVNPRVDVDARGVVSYAESTGAAEDLLEGLEVARLSATSFEIGEGRAWIPGANGGAGELLEVDVPITKAGLILPASSVVWLFLWSNAGQPDLEFPTQPPDEPYFARARVKSGVAPDFVPDETRRWIGHLKTDASGNITGVFSASAPSGHFRAGDGPAVFSGVNVPAAGSLVSADLRGAGGIPPDALGISAHVLVLSQNTNRALYVDSADAPNASPASPSVFATTAGNRGNLPAPFGHSAGANAGRIKLSAPPDNNVVSVTVHATGWWR